jgi:hypothetical protein
MSLGVKGIKGKRGFSRSGQTRQNDQLIARDLNVDVFQIVHTGTLYDDLLWHIVLRFLIGMGEVGFVGAFFETNPKLFLNVTSSLSIL